MPTTTIKDKTNANNNCSEFYKRNFQGYMDDGLIWCLRRSFLQKMLVIIFLNAKWKTEVRDTLAKKVL